MVDTGPTLLERNAWLAPCMPCALEAGRHDMQTALRNPPPQLAGKPLKRHKPLTETALFKVEAACLRLLSRAAQGAFRLFWPRSTAT